MDKICPMMSCRGWSFPSEEKGKRDPFIPCQQEKCALWVEKWGTGRQSDGFVYRHTGDFTKEKYSVTMGHCGLIRGQNG